MSTWNTTRSTQGGHSRIVSKMNNTKVNIMHTNNGNNITNKPIQIKSYKSIYDKVFYNRMKFYHRLSAILAFIVTVLLCLPYKCNIFMFPIKLLLIWTGYFILQKARENTITVDSSKASNKIQKIVSIFCSKKCYILASAFFFNSFIISLIIFMHSDSSLNYYIETPTKTIKPFVNDNFSFFCFFTICSSVVYTFNFLVSEKFILHIPIGTYRQEPINYLKQLPHLKILISSILRSILISLSIPLIYHIFFREIFFSIFLKPLVIFYDLNNQLPRYSFHANTIFKLSFYSWITFLSYDLLSELFNAYALVGCLAVNKPISYFSDTPIQTLLSGMKDYKNPLVRLTSFQELVYFSLSNDFKDRQIFYREDNWTLILAEIFFILTHAARSARSDLPKRQVNEILRRERIQNMKKQASIFGNLNNYKSNFDFDFDFNKSDDENKDNKLDNNEDITIIKKDNENIFSKPEQKSTMKEREISTFESIYNFVISFLNKHFNNFNKRVNIFLVEYFKLDAKKLNANSNKNSIRSQLDTFNSDLVDFIQHLFFGTIEEQSNKRIPNKEIVGFCIIALTELLINAKTEDKRNIVTGTLTESLTLLTKVYKGTSEFLNNPPMDLTNVKNEFSIVVINELAISYFYKLVIYYNNTLNDLILPPEVFKLAKWCTDMALKRQKEQKLSDILQ